MATDKDVQEIIQKAEAGVGDIVQAYESLERDYFPAAATAASGEYPYNTATTATTQEPVG